MPGKYFQKTKPPNCGFLGCKDLFKLFYMSLKSIALSPSEMLSDNLKLIFVIEISGRLGSTPKVLFASK